MKDDNSKEKYKGYVEDVFMICVACIFMIVILLAIIYIFTGKGSIIDFINVMIISFSSLY